MSNYIRWFSTLSLADIETVGGKNASLGEMISGLTHTGVKVPDGFATTASAFHEFLQDNQLQTRIEQLIAAVDVDNVVQLARTGTTIRELILQAQLPEKLVQAVRSAYQTLAAQTTGSLEVAVRSSATAEDLSEASFAGQQETLLNVSGIEAVLQAIKIVFASLFNDRAISYRAHHGFQDMRVALSAGVQRMVRSDLAASGVMFTLDTESGFNDVVFITGNFGLGETVVQGSVNPDEFYVHKPTLRKNLPAIVNKTLGSKAMKMIFAKNPAERVQMVPVNERDAEQFCISDADVLHLARQALLIEKHYGRPMDIEWAKDGKDGEIYIVQARPETVKSRQSGAVLEQFHLPKRGKIKAQGRAIGQKIGAGQARLIASAAQMAQVQTGDVLVTDMTDPDWEPIMKRAAAIVTNRGGRTCHAAIIARELGIPAVVGTNNATQTIKNNEMVTVSCAEGDTGFVYADQLAFEHKKIALDKLPVLPVKIMLNVGNPERAFALQQLPNSGVGLARLEFIINTMIGIHPLALLNYEQLNSEIKNLITPKIAAYASPRDYFIQRLAQGVAQIAAAFYPKPVIVRMSDFKSNEYANLIGGDLYEPHEENPMLGYRGAARYISAEFAECFAMECEALRFVRDTMGLTNVQIMIPFVRTVNEAKQVVDLLATQGLKRGHNDLKLIMMCEIPSNALLAKEFLHYFDGFSIGSNDLTQLTLGIDRDSSLVAAQFDERNPAVKLLLSQAIRTCRQLNKYIGICGQGPSDYPDFAQWLITQGIDSISLNPDSVVSTVLALTG